VTTATKVLYVVGTQRGGSTIAGRLIGQLPGFAFFGELRKLWQVGLPEGRRCGCGLGYADCEVWSAVLPPMLATDDIATIHQWQRTAAPDRRSSLQALRLAREGPDGHGAAVRSYSSLLGATYRALAATTGAAVVVDTSKLPADGVLVSDLGDIDAYLLQLVRDPRGTVYSAIRRSGVPRRSHPRQAVAGSTGWMARHAAAAALARRIGPGRSLMVTYEELVADADAVLVRIAGLVDQPPAPRPIVDHGTVALGVAHTPIGGGRFGPTTVALTRDDRWMTGLGAIDRLVVNALTQPLARHFGYRFSDGRNGCYGRGDVGGIPFSPSRPPGA